MNAPARGEELVTGAQPGHKGRELRVGDCEAVTVTTFEPDAFPQVSREPLDMPRMDRELVLRAPCETVP